LKNATLDFIARNAGQPNLWPAQEAPRFQCTNVKDLGDFMARDPRGQKLPVHIAQLAEHLANEQTTLSSKK
jgi:hypothetical protein